jgi:hypothetical protein
VDAAVTLVRHEADEDFHLVLESGANHMIAESRSPACARGATPYRRRQMREARRPNAIELHPILGFACLSG